VKDLGIIALVSVRFCASGRVAIVAGGAGRPREPGESPAGADGLSREFVSGWRIRQIPCPPELDARLV